MGTMLTNPGHDDRWTCPACYADHTGYQLENTTAACACGARIRLTVDYQPVAVSEIVGAKPESEVPH